MSVDHERIEELLAGYALRSLSGEDAAEVDRLMLDHVPDCPTCRETLRDFEAVAGDLALATPAAEPPELLLPSLRRQTERRRRRPGAVAAWVAAAAMVAVVALSGWSVLLNSKAGDAEKRSAGLSNMINTLMKEDGSQMLTLEGGETGATPSPAAEPPAPLPPLGEPRMLVNFQPGVPHGWLFGMDVPQPTRGYVYQLWLGSGGVYTPTERFVPDEVGVVRVFVAADLSRFDQVAITQEPAAIAVVQPGGMVLWSGVVTQAVPSAP